MLPGSLLLVLPVCGAAGLRKQQGCPMPRLSNPPAAGSSLELAKINLLGKSPSPTPPPTFIFCFRNMTEKKLQKGHVINCVSMPDLFYHRHQISSEGVKENNNAALKPGKRFLLEGCTGAPQHSCCLLPTNKMPSQHPNIACILSQSLTLGLPLLSMPLDKAHTLHYLFSRSF